MPLCFLVPRLEREFKGLPAREETKGKASIVVLEEDTLGSAYFDLHHFEGCPRPSCPHLCVLVPSCEDKDSATLYSYIGCSSKTQTCTVKMNWKRTCV